MRNSKLGLRALGLAILGALSLTAFFAASAQAQLPTLPGASTAGSFQINLGAALLALLTGEQEGIGKLLVPGRNLTIECATGLVLEAKIFTASEALAVLLFDKCLAWNLNLTQHLPCLVKSPEEEGDSIKAKTIALPILHGGQNFVLFEPELLNFVEVELHGATCPLPLLNPVKGSVVGEVVAGTNDTLTPLLKFSEPIQLLAADKLLFGGFPSYIDANANVKLIGDHLEDKLGVV